MPRAMIHKWNSSGWPSPTLIHRDTAPSCSIPTHCPCDGLVLGNAWMSHPDGESRVPVTTEPGPCTNPMAVPLLDHAVGTRARDRPDLSRPPRAPVLPKPWTARSSPYEAQHQGLGSCMGRRDPGQARMLHRCPSTHLWVHKKPGRPQREIGRAHV